MSGRVYYNENDPHVAAWLRELIARDIVAPGEVDERSIVDVAADDLRGFKQCHFFAGIGVWSYALRGSGWADDAPVWTGSCPCQSFSASGTGGGFDDPRHLWPAWFRLILEHRPDVCFGEQTAAKAGLAWLDVVSADMEGAGYAVGAADTSAASAGAPHGRQRLYFVADAGQGRRAELGAPRLHDNREPRDDAARCGSPVRVLADYWRGAEWVEGTDGKRRPASPEPSAFPLVNGTPARLLRLRSYGNALCAPQAVAFIEAFCDVTGRALTTQRAAIGPQNVTQEAI